MPGMRKFKNLSVGRLRPNRRVPTSDTYNENLTVWRIFWRWNAITESRRSLSTKLFLFVFVNHRKRKKSKEFTHVGVSILFIHNRQHTRNTTKIKKQCQFTITVSRDGTPRRAGVTIITRHRMVTRRRRRRRVGPCFY